MAMAICDIYTFQIISADGSLDGSGGHADQAKKISVTSGGVIRTTIPSSSVLATSLTSTNSRRMTDPQTTHQLHSLLGTPLRILLKDNRTIRGGLESIDSNSLLLSRTLETRAPPTTEAEWEVFDNRDRYYPRTESGCVYEIEGLGIARELGAVLVQLGDCLRVEVEKGDWARVRGTDGVI